MQWNGTMMWRGNHQNPRKLCIRVFVASRGTCHCKGQSIVIFIDDFLRNMWVTWWKSKGYGSRGLRRSEYEIRAWNQAIPVDEWRGCIFKLSWWNTTLSMPTTRSRVRKSNHYHNGKCNLYPKLMSNEGLALHHSWRNMEQEQAHALHTCMWLETLHMP